MSLLNKAATKKFILDKASKDRPKFTRVSAEFLDHLDMRVRMCVEQTLRQHPSRGTTVYPIDHSF